MGATVFAATRFMNGASDGRAARESWFENRSHAPCIVHTERIGRVADAIVSLRRRFPHLGPRKLLAMLDRRHPETGAGRRPRRSAIIAQAGRADRAGQAAAKGARAKQRPFAAVETANDEWSVDFKGWFRTSDQQRIDPLTMTDSHSRFLIEVQIAPETIEGNASGL